jgi:hypothetical protein
MATNFEELSTKINAFLPSSIIASVCFGITSITDITLMVIN